MTATDSSRAHAAALAGLPGMTPVRLARLLEDRTSEQAWEAVRSGTHPDDPRRRFTVAARRTDVQELWNQYVQAGVSVLLPGTPGYPSALTGDAGAPAVLFSRGDASAVERQARVAIVGTASPTPYGLQVASQMAAELADGGVTVVSSLSAGIDGAAQAGVVRSAGPSAARPVAVAGTGLDQPGSHDRALWSSVASMGVIFSEATLGTPPNPGGCKSRIIAALSDVVVVVESQPHGEADSVVEAAIRRSIPVCAVPGSVRSRASLGTNQLLVDGCAPVRDSTDVLAAVYLARAGRGEAMVPSLPTDGSTGPTAQDGSRSAGQRPVAGGVPPVGSEAGGVRDETPPASAARASERWAEPQVARTGTGGWSKVPVAPPH